MIARENKEYDPFQDPALRREAGEGWHSAGPNKTVLGALVAREIIAQEIADTRDEEERARLLEEYRAQDEHVKALREKAGIGDPPPRPLE